jgi:hypothetical protein
MRVSWGFQRKREGLGFACPLQLIGKQRRHEPRRNGMCTSWWKNWNSVFGRATGIKNKDGKMNILNKHY